MLTFFVGIAQPGIWADLVFDPQLVLAGEVWRLFTFFFLAPVVDPASPFLSGWNIATFVFAIYFLWILNQALTAEWGVFKLNLYVWTGYLLTVAAGFIAGQGWATNFYFSTSLFLAFAYLFPDFTILLMLILPVKVKWLALITWVYLALMFVTGSMMTKLLVLAAVGNFMLYFARDIVQRLRFGHRRMKLQSESAKLQGEPFHKCIACGRTERSHPKLEFRYCNKCTGAPCYCEEHIRSHEHR